MTNLVILGEVPALVTPRGMLPATSVVPIATNGLERARDNGRAP